MKSLNWDFFIDIFLQTNDIILYSLHEYGKENNTI